MDKSTEVLGQLSSSKKQIDSVTKLSKELNRLAQSLPAQLSKFQARLMSLREAADQLEGFVSQSVRERLCALIDHYNRVLESAQEDVRKQFGLDLKKELEQRGFGLPLTGHYPKLRVSFFVVETDFDRNRAILWYGPEQERLVDCCLQAAEVASRIEKARGELGSHLGEEALMLKLKEAYDRARGNQGSNQVPIIKILSELAYVLQSPKFYSDPRRENYKGYSRADFSYDLFRLHKDNENPSHRLKLRLTVATRAYTRQRGNCLWVPSNDQGEGSFYSHLQLEEVIT